MDEEPKMVNPLAKDQGYALQLVLEMVSRKEHKIPGINTQNKQTCVCVCVA